MSHGGLLQRRLVDTGTAVTGRAVFVRFSLGGSEFRLATSDYSGHGGCQIGTVE